MKRHVRVRCSSNIETTRRTKGGIGFADDIAIMAVAKHLDEMEIVVNEVIVVVTIVSMNHHE